LEYFFLNRNALARMQRRIWCQEHGNSPASCNGASGVRNTEIRPHHACTAEFAFIHSFIHSLTHSLTHSCQFVERSMSRMPNQRRWSDIVAKRIAYKVAMLVHKCLNRERRLIWLMSASSSTHYQNVNSSVLLPLVSCWSPPTSADVGSTVVDQLRGTPCQSLYILTVDLLTPLAEHWRDTCSASDVDCRYLRCSVY